jgi:chloride channel 3/4/5
VQVSLVVIIFELTDGIDYIMPSTICILVAKWVSDAFGRSVLPAASVH